MKIDSGLRGNLDNIVKYMNLLLQHTGIYHKVAIAPLKIGQPVSPPHFWQIAAM